ncbi:hypothetical protein G7K_2713-t1 [Saitoella complicata NRRL Y-17804]|uniref:Uncharacterized protein n=1 Tax=Saitoella complicata (strain BCRC 22490 / CBS 7301 / JCM 7358 / NBRC 10748 / NRRL Y-17804) TaxID=698492 RepID=A0A0E9NGK8_SAICN|nr:hypothetical protein G7K_2713-t1 [Saitoella complicata NRRL Y-17804]
MYAKGNRLNLLPRKAGSALGDIPLPSHMWYQYSQIKSLLPAPLLSSRASGSSSTSFMLITRFTRYQTLEWHLPFAGS